MLRDESKRMTLKERADIHRTLSKYGYAELKSIELNADIKTESITTIEEFISEKNKEVIDAEFKPINDRPSDVPNDRGATKAIAEREDGNATLCQDKPNDGSN